MHAVYMFQHSRHGDEELRWSLRSLERHAPWIEKVWILGDRPAWLADDAAAVEHVPHAAVAWIPNLTLPVRNTFLLMLLAAIHPRIPAEFVWLCDDYVLLDDLSPDEARVARYVEDLDTQSANRGTGLYKEALWRTYDLLVARGLLRLNFETHAPLVLTKERIVAAASEFRGELSQDRYGGPLAQLAVMNLALRREGFVPRLLTEEGRYAGFHYREPSAEEVAKGVAGKWFLNFDDEAYGPALRGFLSRRFPEPCRFESVSASTGTRPGDRVILVSAAERLSPEAEISLRGLEEEGYAVLRLERGGTTGGERNRLLARGLRTHRAELVWVDGDGSLDAEGAARLREPLADMPRWEDGAPGRFGMTRREVLETVKERRLPILDAGTERERVPLFPEPETDRPAEPRSVANRTVQGAGRDAS
jgi:hypothetical protein